MIRAGGLWVAGWASAAAGAGVISAAFGLYLIAPTIGSGDVSVLAQPWALGSVVLFASAAFVVAFVAFAAGLLLLGLPAWLLLHRVGWRGVREAMIAGAGLSVAPPTLAVLWNGAAGGPPTLVGIGAIAFAGAVAGLTFNRVLYRRDPAKP